MLVSTPRPTGEPKSRCCRLSKSYWLNDQPKVSDRTGSISGMTATESSNRTLPCLSGPAATSVPAKWWVCLLADTCGRKNMTSSYWEKWHQLSSLSSVNTNMQLHIRLKWSEVRPWKGAGIYHTVQLCSVITCTCYQDAVWLCSEGRAKLVITDITKKQTNQPTKNKTTTTTNPNNPKTNSNSNNKTKPNHPKPKSKNPTEMALLPSLSSRDPALLSHPRKTDLCQKIPVFWIFLLSFGTKNAPSSVLP